MTDFQNPAYAVRVPNDTFASSELFISVVKQTFFPTINKDQFALNADGVKIVFEAIQKAYKHHMDPARLRGVRSVSGLPILSEEDHRLWKSSKTLSLIVDEENPGLAKMTVAVNGYMDDTDLQLPKISDIGEARLITFKLSALLKDGVYMVLFDLENFEEKSFSQGVAVPLPLTPVISYNYRSKRPEDLRDVESIIGDITQEIVTNGVGAVRWATGIAKDVSVEMVPGVDPEDIYEQIKANVLNWYSWNGGYNDPIQLNYSAMVIPVTSKGEVVAGTLKVRYLWRHMFTIASKQKFVIPLETLDMV